MRRLACTVAIVLTACFEPSVEPCAVRCSGASACPGRLACVEGRCALPGSTCLAANDAGGGHTDARRPADAAVPDAAARPAELIISANPGSGVSVLRGGEALGDCPEDCAYDASVGETISLVPGVRGLCFSTIAVESLDCDLSGNCCAGPGDDGTCDVVMEEDCLVEVSCSPCG